jgi:hypothetical protein
MKKLLEFFAIIMMIIATAENVFSIGETINQIYLLLLALCIYTIVDK